MNKPLSQQDIANLLTPKELASASNPNPDGYTVGGFPMPKQHGIVRRRDAEKPCASRGCRSPSYYRIRTTPYCNVHLIQKLNEMLLELGVDWE